MLKPTSGNHRNIGYLVHPLIAGELKGSPAIADVGTGTGLFLSQIAQQFPTATLCGFDISSELFPATGALPTNMELKVMDVKRPPPIAKRNRFDLVHVRLLTAAMTASDWEMAVPNIVLLLKPGGALQWEEGNFANARHLRGPIDSTVSAARLMGTLFRDSLKGNFSHGWNTLPQIMRASALVNVEEDIVSSDRIPETRRSLTANGMRAIFAWARNRANADKAGPLSMDNLQELEAQAKRDIESGCYVRFDIHVVIGFRPS